MVVGGDDGVVDWCVNVVGGRCDGGGGYDECGGFVFGFFVVVFVEVN